MSNAEALSHWMTLWLVASLVGTLVIAAQSFSRRWATSEREVENAERVLTRNRTRPRRVDQV